jgi:tetratricopeptide (TPR) repeat protein
LLYTQSRGGYLGFFTGAVLFSLVAGRQWLFRKWKELLILGILIFFISALTMLRPEFSPFERFVSEVGTKQETAERGPAKGELELKGAAGSRGETWKSGFKIVADYPLFGIGPEVLKMIFPRYETELFRFKEAFHVKQDRNHNETFDVPVTKGLISFFLYLWFLGVVFKTGFAKIKTASSLQKLMLAGFLAAILSYIVQNQFSFGVVAITSLFWVLLGAVMVLGREEETIKPPAAPIKFSPAEIPWLGVAAVLLLMLPLIYLSFLSFRADIHFKSGKTYLETKQLLPAAEELKKSLAILPFEGTTVSHLGIAYLNLGNTSEALKYLVYGTQVDPYNADNFFMLSRFYLSLFDQGAKEAFPHAWRNIEIALKIDPYYAEAYETQGGLLEREGKAGEALRRYEKAFSVNPTLALPIQKMAELSKKLGQADRARKLFEAAAQRFPENIEVFKALEKFK